MKLRNYFLLSIVVGAAFACSSNEDIPEEHVFTPNATLSLTAGIYGSNHTKAAGAIIKEEEAKEDEIHTLDVLVFSGSGETAQYQTEQRVANSTTVSDIPVEAGSATLVVLANSGLATNHFVGKTLSNVLEATRSLEGETLKDGLSMSSAVIETNISINKHNIFGGSGDFEDHLPAETKGGVIDLYRHVAQVNLKSVQISESNSGAKFVLDEVFVANVKGYSRIATGDDDHSVEASAAPAGQKLWWYGDCALDSWNGEYKTTTDGAEEKDLLAWTPESTTEITQDKALETAKNKCAVASFYVYENRNNTPLGQRTLLVLKGRYTDKSGRDEGTRYYTVSVNDPDMKGSTSTESGDKVSHNYIKRNYRYNISLVIKSSGSDRPYDPASEACMDVAVKVADWDVIEQKEELD